KIGDGLTAKYPNWAKGRPNVLKGPGCDLYERSEAIITCDDTASFTTTQGLTYQRVGDVAVSSLRYKFYEGKLYTIEMRFHPNVHGNIRQMLIGKYGQPTNEAAQSIQNRLGATFENVVTDWTFNEGTLKLYKFDDRIDVGSLTFETPEI